MCAASDLKTVPFSHSTSQTANGSVPLWVIINSCNRMTTAGTFKVVMTPCARSYRFAHISGSPGNGPEMLNAPRPKLEGFRPTGHRGGLMRRRSRTAPMCEDPARILAVVPASP